MSVRYHLLLCVLALIIDYPFSSNDAVQVFPSTFREAVFVRRGDHMGDDIDITH